MLHARLDAGRRTVAKFLTPALLFHEVPVDNLEKSLIIPPLQDVDAKGF